MKKVSVLGFYNHGNTGDQAYKIVFPKIFPNFEFIFTDKIVLNDCDAVFLGGGDVLQTYFLEQLKKLTIPKYAMSVNVKCDKILPFLDVFKQMFIRNVCETSAKVSSVPDFAFALEANPVHGKQIISRIFHDNKAELYERVIIVVMNAYLCSNEGTLARDHVTFDKICYDLAKLMDATSASFLLLPFGNGFPHNDRLAASFVYTKCKYWQKNVILYEELDVQQTLDVISAANMLIGTRLHASIFACIGGTPFIDLTHHDKTSLFLESINKDWGVNYWNFNKERLDRLMTDFSANYERHQQDILQIAKKNRELLLDLPNRLDI